MRHSRLIKNVFPVHPFFFVYSYSMYIASYNEIIVLLFSCGRPTRSIKGIFFPILIYSLPITFMDICCCCYCCHKLFSPISCDSNTTESCSYTQLLYYVINFDLIYSVCISYFILLNLYCNKHLYIL